MRELVIAIVTAIVLVGGLVAASLAADAHLAKRCSDWGHPQTLACKAHN